MKNGIEPFDQQVLDVLEKKYHLFLDSPKGEIQMYLVLPSGKSELEDISDKEIDLEKDSLSQKNILNMELGTGFTEKDFMLNKERPSKYEGNKISKLSNSMNFINSDDCI